LTEPSAVPDLIVAALLVTGSVFALLGAVGFARFHDFYKRIHGPTKATTLGVGCALVASSLHFSQLGGNFSSRELLIALLLFITAPISAQILVKSAFTDSDAGAPPPPRCPSDTSEKPD
jgi:multicomponent K+:H+ antiporter subunit G